MKKGKFHLNFIKLGAGFDEIEEKIKVDVQSKGNRALDVRMGVVKVRCSTMERGRTVGIDVGVVRDSNEGFGDEVGLSGTTLV